MAWVELDHLRLWYEMAGHGPPLVLLHGLGSSSADWALQLSGFSSYYRVIAPDLRGHGRTWCERSWRAISIEHMAADIAVLLERLNARPAHVLGLSMGGCVALHLALDYPGYVRTLTLVNTGATIRPTRRRLLRGLWRVLALVSRGPGAMAQIIAKGLFPQPDQEQLRQEAIARLGQVEPRAYLAALWAVLRFDVRHRLHEIRHPTLVVAGDRDDTLGPKPTRALAEGIPGARLVIIPNSRHATPIDQPQIFNQVVLDFLRGIDEAQEGIPYVSIIHHVEAR
ncbi:MAG TPA: alpha/beta hydrolase [Caldilineae bacterium]|nr:alpha/beta hydrolase [Caldilineae bacterium]